MTRHVLCFPRLFSACCIEFSVTVSRALVASSRRTSGGSLSRHLAMATRCFSPPLSFRPRSPTRLSQPSGCCEMKLSSWASLATRSRSSCVAPLRPYRILVRKVLLKREGHCGTTPMASRRDNCVIFLTSFPKTSIDPSRTS
mmetsp:Transcript_17282/g.34372  ORF Transcript_17282/g.34372 Transcript_17282/m.34372 type:complete len:142 (-) Transcript_17282:169-594(-)